MATQIPANSVWSAMTYVPPRGRCNYKTSLMSPACPCLRFMLHPVKAATSFDFHSLENPAEDAVLRKWEAEEAEVKQQAKSGQKQVTGGAPAKKRRRVAEKEEEQVGQRVIELLDDGHEEDGMLARTMALFGGGSDTAAGAGDAEVTRTSRPRRRKKGVD
ncbi:uncharacterized protein LTR77_009530 [Saxophila tyrrhenica]|uniref:Uncharacterized protein n=1 Tax=Saxophila tyrrhenica TaxID=1690608 RepID=A0AAV9NY31_9PEZI|nr:hypothetical protein LTR77_009530 [Saxophila tyrrhenica]